MYSVSSYSSFIPFLTHRVYGARISVHALSRHTNDLMLRSIDNINVFLPVA